MASIIDSWKYLMRDVKSPDSYIEMAFYFMISAALQRRVWSSSTENPVFPNMYVILVGGPGVGKGLVINPIAEFLRFHKINPLANIEASRDKLDPDLLIALEELKAKTFDQQIRNPDNIEPPLLFPVGADATSYESLVQENAKAISRYKCKEPNQMAPNRLYTHSSIAFVLPELSSLFHSKADRIVQYLIAAYDCKDYTYKTKHQGTDRVKRCCVSFMGGTTPADIKRLFTERLIDDGFTSRVLFVYEDRNRFQKFGRPELEPEQIAAKALIVEYIRNLSNLFGKVEYTPEADEYVRHYYEQIIPSGGRVNFNTKLDAYYARLDLHIMKVAMAIHFSRSLEMIITLSDVEDAVKLLRKLEDRMHLALAAIGNNPLHGPSKRVIQYLHHKLKGATLKEIWTELEGDVREAELAEILTSLVALGKINRKLAEDNKTELFTII